MSRRDKQWEKLQIRLLEVCTELLDDLKIASETKLLRQKLCSIMKIYDEYETLTGKKLDEQKNIVRSFHEDPNEKTLMKFNTSLIMALKSPLRELDGKIIEMRKELKTLLIDFLSLVTKLLEKL